MRFADCRCQGRPGGQDRRQDGGRQEGQGKHGQYTSTSAPPGLLHSASRLETCADSWTRDTACNTAGQPLLQQHVQARAHQEHLGPRLRGSQVISHAPTPATRLALPRARSPRRATRSTKVLHIFQQHALSASVKVHLCASVTASHTCCLLPAASSVRPL